MKKYSKCCILLIITTVMSLKGYSQNPNFHIYLCFGQSNMEGTGTIESQDRTTNVRVKVLADQTCSNLNRTYGTWYTASPPLNRCWSGLGPADYFGKTMATNTHSAITIGLVPASVSGCDIALFQKSAPIGRGGADIPSQFNGGYAWLLDLAKKAQQAGVIKGIIFHQGETNTNDPNWKYKVQEIVKDLRLDLNLGNVPFLAGELLYAEYGSCCSSHNVEVNKLPELIPNCEVIPANDLAGKDVAHFTSASYRELGNRYAQKMLTLVNSELIITAISDLDQSPVSMAYPNPTTGAFTITHPGRFDFTLIDQFGKVVEEGKATDKASPDTHLPRGLYLLEVKSAKSSKVIKLVKY